MEKIISIFICSLTILLLVNTTYAIKYTYIEILPPGFHSSQVNDINNNGEVVGFGFDGTNDRGFIYSGSSYTVLLPPGWSESRAVAINDNGVVAGYGYDSSGVMKGFVYNKGYYTEIQPTAGWSAVFVTSINNNGDVIGTGYDGITWKGFIYSNGSYTELLPPHWTRASANDINDDRIVVGDGYSGSSFDTQKGFFYRNGI